MSKYIEQRRFVSRPEQGTDYMSELLGTCSLTLNKSLTLHLCQFNHLLYVYNNTYLSFRITIKFS